MSKFTRAIPVDSLYMENNVRSEECMLIPQMVESLRIHGFRVNHPLRVSEKSDGRFLVLAGNRRTSGLLFLKDNDPETYRNALPGGKVPCVVDKGLTVEQEIEIRIDHSDDLDRVPLDEWSIFLAIKQLATAGFDTQEKIAIKMGLRKKDGKPRREYVQVRVNLASMPQFVQDEFRKLTLDRNTTPIRWNMVSRLYKVYNDEFLDHAAGDGPLFKAEWAECMTPPNVNDPDDTTAKTLTPAEAIKKAQAANSAGLRDAILAMTRQGDIDLVAVDRRIQEGETAVHTLRCICEYLGEVDSTALVASSLKQYDDKHSVVEELAETIAE